MKHSCRHAAHNPKLDLNKQVNSKNRADLSLNPAV